MCPAEIKMLNITGIPFEVRFGLGSEIPIKRWSRFKLNANGDFTWTRSFDIRRDESNTDIHISFHKSGKVVLSRYQHNKKVYSSVLQTTGSSLEDIKQPVNIESGNELFELGYFYHGLKTVQDKDMKQTPKRAFIACREDRLINSRLYYSVDILPWTDRSNVRDYVTKTNSFFNTQDPRCHLFIFRLTSVSIVVTMGFTEGDSPVDVQHVHESDQHIHPLKRLFHHEGLALSDSVALTKSIRNNYNYPK